MSDESPPVILEASLDISRAEALKAQLMDALETQPALRLQAEAVERITTPAIQIILALLRSCDKAGKPCEILSPSEAMQTAFAQLGLSDHLQQRAG